MTVPHVSEMKTEKPTVDGVADEMAQFHAGLEKAADADAQADVVKQWDASRNRVRTWSAMVGLHFNQDTRNDDYRKDRDYRDEISPKLIQLDNDFKGKLLDTARREKLENVYGKQAFDLWACDQKAHSPDIETEQVRISKLTAEYTELLSDASFEIGGETVNMSGLGKYTKDDDRKVREESTRKKWQWFAENRERLDAIYHELTQLRHTSAKKLNLKDYIELGYLRMHRVDYDRDDVKSLRKQIVDEVVPLCTELAKQQATDIGVDKLMVWDESIYDAKGSPRPHGDHDWMVERAKEMFDDVGHGLGEFSG